MKKAKDRRWHLNGKTYKLVVLRVVEEDHNGNPILLRHLAENETAHLSKEDPQANKFLIVLGEEDSWPKR